MTNLVEASNGIIPAHAGFTAGVHPRVSRPPDHPRTRGVYRRLAWAARRSHGSSPHTRGLRPVNMYDNPTAWIIPARAGFTRSGPCARCRAGGSSPHTRGLRRPCRRPLPCRGIIPAHAGFTASSVPPGGSWPDHPRTRGVYANRSGSVQVAGGSSPHTRGLHLAASGEHAAERIIPAHAGFTRGPRNRCLRWPDHPRTRGVYYDACVQFLAVGGSSPHTRGLLQVHLHLAVLDRIIPAHAGFT